MHETFRVASTDDTLMTVQKLRSARQHVKKMESFFAMADIDKDGKVTLKEFEAVMGNRKIRSWFAAMDLDVRDVRLVFELLDDGDGQLSAEEIVTGTLKLKSAAR